MYMKYSEHNSRELLLMCRSEYEINQMRNYVSKNPNSDMTANGFFFNLSADCLRYIEVLKKVGIDANNINSVELKEG